MAEADLIAFQMGEPCDEAAILAHLETCPECAEMANSFAETVRVFSAEPLPPVDVDRAWRRLRPNLPVLPRQAPRRPFRLGWIWSAAGVASLAAAILLVVASPHPPHRIPIATTLPHPGPITSRPVNPQIAAHLDSAERFLTEVSHTSEPLDPLTREQARTLLLRNAAYVRSARQAGDLADAAVLEQLDRVLTAVDNEPTGADSGWHIRFEINTNGLLLDLRILRQNETQRHPQQTTDLQETLP